MPDAASSEPQRIGPYRIERPLGRGGMGEVWLGWDERLERRVALKRLRADAVPSPHLQARLLREARAAARLSHPSIVRIFDLLEVDGDTCLVLEFVEGQTVAARLLAGALPLAQALGFGHDVAEGLAAAHRAGLVHRDLKAENVIVAADGQAKILDFGLVRPLLASAQDEGLTETGALLGTLRSMAPEQAAGGPVDHRADLFALGVLLYEMVSGVSPFRGATAVETLRRLAAADPLPVSQLRPGLPPELVELIGRLLAREADDRPSDSAEVAAQLGRLAGAASNQDEEEDGSVSDLPTRSVELPAFSSSAASSAISSAMPAPAPISPLSPPSPRRRSRLRLAALATAGALALAALAAAAYLAFHASAPPRRVVVLPPALPAEGSAGGLDRLATAAQTIVLDALASAPGLAVFDSTSPDLAAIGIGTSPSPATAARQLASDEVLRLSLSPRGSEVRIDLRRLDGRNDRVLWAGSVTVPGGEGEEGLLRDALGAELRRAYPSQLPKEGTGTLEVRPADYAAYLAVRRDLRQGEIDREPLLRRLEEILRTSPAFLEAELSAAEVALSLFESTREEAVAATAARHLAAALRLAPADPRPLFTQGRLALDRGRPAEAASAVAALEKISPADPEVAILRAAVAELAGRPQAALRDLREAVRRAPSWRALYLLADLEAHQGEVASARGHLNEILAAAPANEWALSRLGTLELTYGDLRRAESIYLQLVRGNAQRHDLTNLGLARFLLGRYPEAIEAYRRALALDPRHPVSLLNLADAEAAAGREAEARSHYAEVLDRLGAPGEAGSTVRTSLLRAQSLAALGRREEAAAEAQTLLRKGGDDPFVQYSVALVYSLIGDRTSARVNAKAARRGGIQPRWFAIPGFRPLRGDPELTSLWNP